jgi:hypothetical protein
MTTDEISERLFAARDHWRQTQTLTADEARFLLGAVSQLLGQVEHLENYCDEECLATHKTAVARKAQELLDDPDASGSYGATWRAHGGAGNSSINLYVGESPSARFFVMDGSGKTTELPPAVRIDMGGKTVSEVVQSWKGAARARRERGEGDTPGI